VGRGKAGVTLDKMEKRGQDKLGRWYWRVRGPDPVTGRRVTLETGRWTAAEAEEQRERHEAAATLGLALPSDTPREWSVSELVRAYVEEMTTRLGDGHTYVEDESKRLTYVEGHLGAELIGSITQQRLEQYVAARRRNITRNGTPPARKSLVEELLCLLRAYRTMQGLKKIATDPPPMPLMKSVPDDSRPQRRLTKTELAALLASAELEEEIHGWAPEKGSKSRALYDQIAARPGVDKRQFYLEIGGGRMRDLASTLKHQGKIVEVDGRLFLAEPPPPRGYRSLFTVLAWTGRRPIAVFAARVGDCARLLDEHLPRHERLMFWAEDKGGVGRGWGPVPEPAYHALRERAQQLAGQPDARLWLSPQELPWTPVRLATKLYRIAARAKVEGVQLYDLRRFAITSILAEVRGQTAVARKYTGHKSDRALLRYVFAPEGEAEGAAARIGWGPAELHEVGAGEANEAQET
jgi:integrase